MNSNNIPSSIVLSFIDIYSIHRGLIYRAINTSISKAMPDELIDHQVKHLSKDKLYLGAWEGCTFAGVWIVDLSNWEFHTSLLPHTAGRGASIARAGLDKMFGHGAPFLYTYAPAYNRAAILLAKRLGFTERVANHELTFYGGKAYPIHHFTLTKEDYYASRTVDRDGRRRSSKYLVSPQPEEASQQGS